MKQEIKAIVTNYPNGPLNTTNVFIWSIMAVTETHCIWQDLDIVTKEHLQVEINHFSKFNFPAFWVTKFLLHRIWKHPGLISKNEYDMHKWSGALWPDGRIHLFAHYHRSLSSLCRLIWRHLAYAILSNAFRRLSQFSQWYFMQYIGLCVLSLPSFLAMSTSIYCRILSSS